MITSTSTAPSRSWSARPTLALLATLALLPSCQESVLSFPGKDAGEVDAGGGMTCGAGTTACGAVCVNLEKDPNHCGSCATACATTEGCAANKCYPKTCTGTDCATNQLCDQEHCREAACFGVVCPQGQACFEGTCRTQSCGATTCTGHQVCLGGVCIDPDCTGITCAQGASCRDGQCLTSSTCQTGVTCSPATNPCHLGVTSCDAGVLACNEQNVNATNGIACGDGGVCSSGACVSCASGKDCAVANPCHVGKTSCAAGVESCVDSTVAQPNGTPCGTNQICLAGACSSCTDDAGCMPTANPCHKGAMQCSAAGGPACHDTQVQQPVGTTCGTDSVCGLDGGCVPCRAGVACALPGQPCRDGVISCASGEAVCVDQNAKPAGTTCDGGICNTTGVCAPCVNGSTCTPTDCTQGVISCGVGGATCGNVSNVAAGSACTGGVCVGSTCVPCVADASCTDNPNPSCRLGKVQCSATGRACVDDTAKSNGTSCTASGGSAGVCSAGACVACVQNQACTTNPNACMTGKLDCSTGTPTCVNDANKTAGAACSGGVCSGTGTCNACVAGAACTGNSNACTSGTTVCSSGAAVCADGAARTAGTACPGGVCNGSGTCNACTDGATCTGNPGGECYAGTTVCSSGAAVCTNGAAKGAGTACSGGVCNGSGTCNACNAGQACTGNPNPACKTGVIDCSSGAPTCTDGPSRSDGTLCGSNKLMCSTGACVSPAHCKALLAANAAAPSGVYTIDPDGAGGAAAFDAYCDMTTQGGGWTALLPPSASGLSRNAGLTATTSAISGTTNSCAIAPSYGALSGENNIRSYICGDSTIRMTVSWTNTMSATELLYSATLEGTTTHALSINGTNVAPDATLAPYGRCDFWNGTATSVAGTGNTCWQTVVTTAPPRKTTFSGNLTIITNAGPACSPDCTYGAGSVIYKLYVR